MTIHYHNLALVMVKSDRAATNRKPKAKAMSQHELVTLSRSEWYTRPSGKRDTGKMNAEVGGLYNGNFLTRSLSGRLGDSRVCGPESLARFPDAGSM
jgi:hypothetical protein